VTPGLVYNPQDQAKNIDTKPEYTFYQLGLLDSIQKMSYGGDDKTPSDDISTRLKLYYPTAGCLPSAYNAKTHQPSMPVKLEKANMTISGDRILNKHLAYYPDADFLVVNKTADIDYIYNPGDKVINRSGTDFGLLIFPEIYGNKSVYTYAGNNITKISTSKEQSGYDLNNLFDTYNNPFNQQGGVLYYLSLRSYPDMEHFETLSLNRNNTTQVKFEGTDISNQRLTITYQFTYTYNAANYPEKVNIVQTSVDDIAETTIIANLALTCLSTIELKE